MFDTILFDLDGTLTDPAEGITNSVAYSLKKFGITVEDKASLLNFIGPPLLDSYIKYFGFTEAEGYEAIEFYREYFKEIGIFENKIYQGIAELLSELKDNGKRIILATSKPEPFAKVILEHFDIVGYFDFVCGSLLDNTRTDKHEVIEFAIDECNVTRSAAVMVGDRLHDIIGGKKSRLSTIGVTYGYGSEEELLESGADMIAHDIEELRKILIR